MKIVRVFVDPFFETSKKTSKETPIIPNSEKNTPPKPILGDYVEYEEVK